MEMYIGKVTTEYAEEEQECMKREARQQSRLNSTTEMSHANKDVIDEPIDIHTESEGECEESLLTSPEPTSVSFITTRKNQKGFQEQSKRSTLHLRPNLFPSIFHCGLKVHLVQEFLLK